MTTIDFKTLAQEMATAALPHLTSGRADIDDVATVEFKRIAETLALIERGILAGTIKQDDALAMIEAQKSSARIALLAVEDLALLAVQSAINAGLNVARTTVNTALNFTLL